MSNYERIKFYSETIKHHSKVQAIPITADISRFDFYQVE